ncbi:hypothetical protein XENOCAPTIV_001688 [Xenoophorus captivus]|uniref:Uncharacterized protein n=1 Tax=Xenoophorus captivus TaxID=1517983 RepID=A0ABV0QXV9_9TELE
MSHRIQCDCLDPLVKTHLMKMASAQLRVFSSNNIDICIINPRIPVVETGASGHSPPPSLLPPIPLILRSTACSRRELEGKGGDFTSSSNRPGSARKKQRDNKSSGTASSIN